MVDQIAVVQFRTPAAPGTLNITHPDLTEAFSAALLIFSGVDEGLDGTDVDGGAMGIGWVAAENGAGAVQAQCLTTLFRDALTTTTQAFNSHSNSNCILVGDNAGATVIAANFSTAIANGVQLNFATASVRAKCVAILFHGLARASTGLATITTGASAHYNVGPAGTEFQADLLHLLAADGSLAIGANSGVCQVGFALNLAGVPQKAAYINVARSSDPTDADGYLRSDAATASLNGDRTVAMERAVIGSFDATGFNATAPVSQVTMVYLALKWSNPTSVRCALANSVIAASTGIQAFNAFGFTPDVAFGMSSLLTAEDAIENGAAGCAAGYFVTGRHGSRAYTIRHDRGHTINALDLPASATHTNTRQEDVALLTYDTAGAVVQRATWDGGSGAGGFQLNFSIAGTAGFLTALGIQIIPVAVVTPPSAGAVGTARRPARARTVVGGARHSIMGSVLRELGRFRRAALARIRWRPQPEGVVEPVIVGVELEEDPKGRVSSPGALRGRILGAESFGRVSSSGTGRGIITGQGVESEDLIDP